MFCTSCGAQNSDTAFRCANCNEPITPMGPSGGTMYSASAPTQNYLVQSILVTLFCCQPLGIVGIVFSALTMGHVSAGRFEEAQSTAAQAKTWSTWGFVIGLVVIVLYLVFAFAVGGLSAAGGGSSSPGTWP